MAGTLIPSVTVTARSDLMGGLTIIHGTITHSNTYSTGGGESLDLSSYFVTASYPSVIIGSAAGYVFQHDGGTAAAGKVIARSVNINATSNVPLIEVAASADLHAAVSPFIAIGNRFA